jgi:hypothetical protein
MEAEDKAARLFADWQNLKRHTLAEGNPEVLAQSRRRYIEHHEKTFIPYLDFEGTTHPQLLSRLKFILRDVKAGRDTRTTPEHLTNRLAHRMKNARIIQYLGQRIQSASPENRQAFEWLEREYPAIFEAYEKGHYSDITIYTFEDWRTGKTNYIHPTAQPVTDAKKPEKRYLDILPPTEAERIKTYRIETAERLINTFLEPRKKAFEALPPSVQKTERGAIKTALEEGKETHIKAPTGDIYPMHTAKAHQSPANYIASAYKYVTDENYFQEVRQTPPEDITKHPYLMAEALSRYLNWIDSQEGGKAEKKAKPQAEAGTLTAWEQCMYYRYLYEAGAPSPFDNDRPKQEAYNDLAERHGGSAAHWKNTWLETEPSNRKHEGKRRQTGLKKVLKLLKQYPDAYRICEMELRNAGIL